MTGTGCLKAAQMKALIQTMLDPHEGRLLTVNCAVSTSGLSVSVEERVSGSPYWK